VIPAESTQPSALSAGDGSTDSEAGNNCAASFDESTLRLIGHSDGMQKVRDLIGRVAPMDSAVLICGESGTGKELVAESIHAQSQRADKPFLAINCAAIPPSLIEAELFGHERGGFSGALRTREGVFERASGGTLLLDEITEMPLELQSRLLRVLETKRLGRAGSSSDLEVDVRVLATTNRRPSQAFAEGRLREDIYYRLAVVTVHLPPLRERGEDVIALAESFLADLNLRNGTRKYMSGDLRQRFLQHPWPGNVRELRNAVERAFILCDSELNLSPEEMPALHEPVSGNDSTIEANIGSSLADVERKLILATLKHFSGDKRRSADVLGCSLKTLYNKLHAYQRNTDLN
jgi:two-component system response regulator HydG